MGESAYARFAYGRVNVRLSAKSAASGSRFRIVQLVVIALGLCAGSCLAQSADVTAKAGLGKQLMGEGRFEEAVPVYRELAAALPGNPGPLLNLGMALHMAGHETEAIPVLRQVLHLDPHNSTAPMFLGAAYVSAGEPVNAIAPLKLAVHRRPEEPERRLLLAQALLAVDRFSESVEQFDRLTRLSPAEPKVWYGLGSAWQALASANFDRLEQVAPGSPYWAVLVAEAKASADQKKTAILIYRQALQKAPRLRSVHQAIANLYRELGHPEWADIEEGRERSLPPLQCAPATGRSAAQPAGAAERATTTGQRTECDFWAGNFRQVIRETADAHDPVRLYWRVRAFNELSRGAFAHLAQLPPSAEIHHLVAQIYFNDKNYPAAASEWRRALALAPEDREYKAKLAEALAASGSYDQALQIFPDLLKQQPDSPELNYWYGFTLLGLSHATEAIPYLERAVERDPGALPLHRDLAKAYLQAGLAAKAIPHFVKALPLDTEGSLYYQLANAYKATGQPQRQKAMLTKFREVANTRAVVNSASGSEIAPP